MTLKDLKLGETAIITKVRGRGAFRKRILEMGFVSGQRITAIKSAPMNDPVEYKLMDYNITLRNSEAEMIDVVSLGDHNGVSSAGYEGTLDNNQLRNRSDKIEKIINVAFVGNPNSGKTTIFNHASGSKERVGNYAGVTIDSKTAKVKINGYVINIIDLPGTYSISAYSPEELFVRDHIINNTPDIVINVIDASNLERNLYLTTQLIDMDVKIVAALNMYDELNDKGLDFDYDQFGKLVGIPFVPTVGTKGKGIKELFGKVIEVFEDKDKTVRHVHINYGIKLETSINAIQEKIKIPENYLVTDRISSRFLAIKLLENDDAILKEIEKCVNYEQIVETAKIECETIECSVSEDSESLITDAKYGFIAGALNKTLKTNNNGKIKHKQKADNLLTHKILGIPIFLSFMWFTFFVTFTLGDYPMNWIQAIVDAISGFISNNLGSGMIRDFLIDGIIGGVGGVIVFLPNIMILYFFIALMEDTGYLARAVFIMDKAMHKIGLHGKSFIPLLMGFGCNVPAILSSRIIDSKKDRMITMLINPFMSCSARMPVYVLFISAFFITHRATVLFIIYFTGVLLAIISALIFRKTLFKTADVPFVMELPPYRMPTAKALLKHTWHRGQHYLKKVGSIILYASVIIWALGYFPRNIDYSTDYKAKINSIRTEYTSILKEIPIGKSNVRNKIANEMHSRIEKINIAKESERQRKSYIGIIGRLFAPVIRPLGFDWKMGVSLITGIAAKEIVVSSMGVLYQAKSSSSGDNASLIDRLKQQRYSSGPRAGEKVLTPLVAFTFMLFILIYFPCTGVVAAIKRESGSWKWALFSVTYSTTIAWIVSFLVYHIGMLIL